MGKQDERSKKKDLPKDAKTRIQHMKVKVMLDFDESCRVLKDRRVAARVDIETRIETTRKNLRKVRTEIMPKLNRCVENVKHNLHRLSDLTIQLDASKKQIEDMVRASNPANVKKLLEKEKRALEKELENLLNTRNTSGGSVKT